MSFLNINNLVQKNCFDNTEKNRRAFRNGLRHDIYEPNGNLFKGEWIYSYKEGKGQLTTKLGYFYENDWQKNLRWGNGKDALITRVKKFELMYTGEWIKGYKHGSGRLRYKDGTLYDGHFSTSQRDGIGIQWFPNGDYYEGEWKNDHPDGFGIYIQANGNRYEGEWKCGKKHGNGIFLHLDNGQIQRGIWSFGKCKISKIFDIYWRQSSKEPTEYPIHECTAPDDIYKKKKEYILKQNDKRALSCQRQEKVKNMEMEKEKSTWIPCYINIKKALPSPYF